MAGHEKLRRFARLAMDPKQWAAVIVLEYGLNHLKMI